jgi:hypothetical protein
MANFTFVVPQKKVVIFYSLKAGNTSLTEYVYELFCPAFLLDKNTAFQRRFLKSPSVSMSSIQGYQLVNRHNFTGVVLSRNPYQRAVSAFVNKFVRDGNKNITDESKLELFSKSLLDFSLKSGICKNITDGITFIEFLSTIKEMRVARVTANRRAINPHWNVQVPDFLANKNFFSKNIKIENIKNDIDILNQLLGLNKPFPRLRSTERSGILCNQSLDSIPSFQIAKLGFDLNSNNFLSDTTKVLIREIYDIDFIRFKYEY